MLDTLAQSQTPENCGFFRLELGGDENCNGAANGLFGIVPEQSSRAGVPAGNDAIEVLGNDGIVRGRHNRSQTALSLFRLAAAADVFDYGNEMLQFAILIARARDAEIDPDSRFIFSDIALFHREAGQLTSEKFFCEDKVLWKIVGMGDFLEGELQEFSLAVSYYLAEFAVGAKPSALGTHMGDAHGCQFECGALKFFALQQCLLERSTAAHDLLNIDRSADFGNCWIDKKLMTRDFLQSVPQIFPDG